MKINWHESCLGVQLKTLKSSDCFFCDQVLYIKTNIEEQQSKIMAVNLEDGIVKFFCPDTIVIPIDAEIRINGN